MGTEIAKNLERHVNLCNNNIVHNTYNIYYLKSYSYYLKNICFGLL